MTESLKQLIRVTVNLMVKEEMREFRDTMRGELGAIYFSGSYSRDMKAPLGVSQRKVAGIAKSCFGITLSANRVGHVYRELAEKEESVINTKPLSN